MSANPHANGGELLRALRMPDFRDYAVAVPTPGTGGQSRRPACSGTFLRDVDAAGTTTTFRLFGPDETASNRLGAVFEVTDRAWLAEIGCPATTTWPPTAGSWRSCPSTCARAGWRATC